ncbi:hypothetical protein BC943DRAFT_329612 [Umbelopsis sp. AD052]|nr:hypothetical protein BC943DRAFT_329612 [Umbelopsis sp. AD052]
MFGLLYSFLLLSAAHQCLAFTLLYSSSRNSSYAFLQQLRIHDFTKSVCTANMTYPWCDIELKKRYNSTTRHTKTVDMLKAALQAFPDEHAFFIAEDGILPDIDYILGVSEEIETSGKMYWGGATNCSVPDDGSKAAVCMQEDFYGFSRPLATCFVEAASHNATNSVNQGSFFGDTVYQHCKHLDIEYSYRNESLIWKKVFHDMNKCVNLNFSPETEECAFPQK